MRLLHLSFESGRPQASDPALANPETQRHLPELERKREKDKKFREHLMATAMQPIASLDTDKKPAYSLSGEIDALIADEERDYPPAA